MTLRKGKRYDVGKLQLVGWTRGDGSSVSGYNLYDYFTSDGRYLGADQHRIAPIVKRKANNPGGRKLTKKQRKAKAARTAKKTRVAKAAKALLKAVRGNPARRFRGAMLTKYKDGSIKITPVKGVVRK
jgi:hypothetical protein